MLYPLAVWMITSSVTDLEPVAQVGIRHEIQSDHPRVSCGRRCLAPQRLFGLGEQGSGQKRPHRHAHVAHSRQVVLVVVARPTRRHHILPSVRITARQEAHVIPGQQLRRQPLTAVQAGEVVAAEQRPLVSAGTAGRTAAGSTDRTATMVLTSG